MFDFRRSLRSIIPWQQQGVNLLTRTPKRVNSFPPFSNFFPLLIFLISAIIQICNVEVRAITFTVLISMGWTIEASVLILNSYIICVFRLFWIMALSKSFFLFPAATLLEYSTKDLTYLKRGMKNLIEGKHTAPLWLLTLSLNNCHQSV